MASGMADMDSKRAAFVPPHLRLREAAATANAAEQEVPSSDTKPSGNPPRSTRQIPSQTVTSTSTIRQRLGALGVKVDDPVKVDDLVKADDPMPWARPSQSGQPNQAPAEGNPGLSNGAPSPVPVSQPVSRKQNESYQRGRRGVRGGGRGGNRGGSVRGTVNGHDHGSKQGTTRDRNHRDKYAGNHSSLQGINQITNPEGKSVNNQQITSNNNHRGKNGRGSRGGVNRGGFWRKTPWPTSKDFPPADTTFWETKPDDWESHVSDFQLGDWSGKWNAAPIDWDSRPAFRTHQTSELIETWLVKIDEEMRGLDWAIPMVDVTVSNGATLCFAPSPKKTNLAIQGEPAPRYWIPGVLGRQTASMFWAEFLLSKTPMPVDEGDLVGAIPWWERYETADRKPCAFLRAYPTPEMTGIDPDENENERMARENDLGSVQHTNNRRGFERAKNAAARERKEQQKERARLAGTTGAPRADRIKTGIKIYVRTAGPGDIKDVLQIYNHYIDNSISVPELQRLDESSIQARLDAAEANRLPFLVACQRGGRVKARGKGTGEDIILPDTIVGFAAANDFVDRTGMYRFTTALETYTRSDVLMKGVANCLVDKLVTMLDPHYMTKGGYEVRGADIDGIGAGRYMENIVVQMPYDTPQRLEWATKWLQGSYGFDKVGDLKNIGIKGGKRISLAIFQRATGVEIDPAIAPVMS